MPETPEASRWARHLVCRAEHTRTTWKLRLGLLVLLVVALRLTSGWWAAAIARSCVCDASLTLSDAILVENFDPDYLVFERASQLRRAGLAARVLVPIHVDRSTQKPNDVALGIAEVMARISGIGAIEVVPVRDVEPISLNAAQDVQNFLERGYIRSVIVVAPLFRSRRSALVYTAVLGQAGVTVACDPARSTNAVGNWTQSWHGIEDVAQQWLKLQYYRLYVLPFRLRSHTVAPLIGHLGDPHWRFVDSLSDSMRARSGWKEEKSVGSGMPMSGRSNPN